MPEVEIRPAETKDLPHLMSIDPAYESARVWQFESQPERGDLGVTFKEVRLPRPAKVHYPRTNKQIFANFEREADVYLTATLQGEPAGFVRLSEHVAPGTAWIKDLVVREDLRLRGIGAALLLSSLEWSLEQGDFRRMTIEMQSKNFPAFSLARKLGFEYAGFSDQFYFNKDIALFFSISLR